MKESLKQALDAYNTVVKMNRESGAEWNDPEVLALEDELSLRNRSTRGTDPSTEAELLQMQKAKRDAMDTLHVELQKINRGENVEAPKGALHTVMRDGVFFARSPGSSDEYPCTSGDIMIGPDVGVDFHLDEKSMPRAIRKRYAFEKARHAVSGIADMQIMHDEAAGHHSRHGARRIYQLRLRDAPGRGHVKVGFLVEKIARLTLKKLAIDCELPFEVINADVHEDVGKMTDFYIRKKGSNRLIAVQITTNPDEQEYAVREARVANAKKRRTDLEDFIVSKIRLGDDTGDTVAKWTKGMIGDLFPLDVVPSDSQALICEEVLRKVFPGPESEEIMQKIRSFLQARD